MGYNPQIESPEEARVCADLDVNGYGGKWRAAKDYVRRNYHLTGMDFWLKVRMTYLELGGEYNLESNPYGALI